MKTIRKATAPTTYCLKGKDGYTRFVETKEQVRKFEQQFPGNWTVLKHRGACVYTSLEPGEEI
jgi:hypothetical protein